VPRIEVLNKMMLLKMLELLMHGNTNDNNTHKGEIKTYNEKTKAGH